MLDIKTEPSMESDVTADPMIARLEKRRRQHGIQMAVSQGVYFDAYRQAIELTEAAPVFDQRVAPATIRALRLTALELKEKAALLMSPYDQAANDIRCDIAAAPKGMYTNDAQRTAEEVRRKEALPGYVEVMEHHRCLTLAYKRLEVEAEYLERMLTASQLKVTGQA